MQIIISSELKGDHCLTYEEALVEEEENLKKVKVCLFFWLSFAFAIPLIFLYNY
jgi:hypothetical protein